MSIIDNRTTRLSLPLPNTQNNMTDDCARLIAALNSLDGVVALSTDLNSYTTTTLMNQALALKADSFAMTQALWLKADASALASKADSAGSTANLFNVAPAVNDGHAVQKSQMNTAIAAAMGNYKDKIIVTGAATLTVAQSGSWVESTGATGYAITLPAAANNIIFTINNIGATSVTIGSTGGALIHWVDSAATSLSLPVNGSVTVACDGASWFAVESLGLTPDKFDSSNKPASTSFVVASGLRFPNGGSGVAASTTLPIAAAGSWFEIQTNGITITLPPLSNMPSGVTFSFRTATGLSGYIKGYNDEYIIGGRNGAQNSIALLAGEMITLTSNGGIWYMTSGGFDSGSFTKLASVNGYQKLPSGLIIQWGKLSSFAADGATLTDHYLALPITFPNSAIGCASTNFSFGNAVAGVIKVAAEPTRIRFRIQGVTDLQDFTYIAIGY